MEKKKPLKRDPNLVPFSHDHHHGLMFSVRLKKGVKEKTDFQVLRSYIDSFWNASLEEHFDGEEDALLPFMKEDDSLTLKFKKDHKEIRKLVSDILESAKEEWEKAEELSIRINDHIRFEERKLFPALEEKLSPSELAVIGKKLLHKEADCPVFKPEFWK